MQQSLPITRELVLVGGGHTHALVLRAWGMRPLPGVRVTLIDPGWATAYSGMLPGLVAGHYPPEALQIDLVRLARFAGARFVAGRAVALDADARTITLDSGRQVAFDVASLDIGITTQMPDLPGFAEHGLAAKPLNRFAEGWNRFLAEVNAGRALPRVAVIGGGLGGIELALAANHALRATGIGTPQVTLVERDRLLASRPGLAGRLRREMLAAGLTLREGTEVTAVSADGLELDPAPPVAADLVIGVAGARPHEWLAGTGLPLERGFVTVAPDLSVLGRNDIFAVGDCAHFPHAPRPKAGVFAVRAAPVLLHNLTATLTGAQLRRRPFRPQSDYLKLVALGPRTALADKWGLRLRGPAIWRLKDRIDQRFMDKFRHLPAMQAPPLPRLRAAEVDSALGDKPLCGGCGAKVGGDLLAEVVTALPTTARPDVAHPAGDDAAVLTAPGGGRLVISTDHLRAFTEDPATMARIAAVHALGDIWAMGARPQAALATVILPRLSDRLQRQWLAEIMAAAAEVFAAEGATVAGGHTTLGAELTIGFTVTGIAPDRPLTLHGAGPGDALILTRPLGSGTIMAAEMAMQARGDWVLAALQLMSRPQGDAAGLLAGAHAMTDVTGFGLAGHLMNMARASGVAATVDVSRVPLLPGAAELAAQGVRSSLYPANRQLVPALDPGQDPRATLLFDPQTAGGLLAAVPGSQAEGLVAALTARGHGAALIGHCQAGPPGVSLG